MTLQEWLSVPGNTQQVLAERLGVTQPAVSQWVNWLKGKKKNATRITGERAVQIEVATDGKVRRQTMRPELFGVNQKARRH